MNAQELRVLLSLLVKLGISATDGLALFRQHGVSEEQIAEADLENQISVYDRIQSLRES